VVVDAAPQPSSVPAGAAIGGGAQTEEKTSRDTEAVEGLAHVGESSGMAEVIWLAFAEGSGTFVRVGGNPNQWGGLRLTWAD
jgi:hypothetical protein